MTSVAQAPAAREQDLVFARDPDDDRRRDARERQKAASGAALGPLALGTHGGGPAAAAKAVRPVPLDDLDGALRARKTPRGRGSQRPQPVERAPLVGSPDPECRPRSTRRRPGSRGSGVPRSPAEARPGRPRAGPAAARPPRRAEARHSAPPARTRRAPAPALGRCSVQAGTRVCHIHLDPIAAPGLSSGANDPSLRDGVNMCWMDHLVARSPRSAALCGSSTRPTSASDAHPPDRDPGRDADAPRRRRLRAGARGSWTSRSGCRLFLHFGQGIWKPSPSGARLPRAAASPYGDREIVGWWEEPACNVERQVPRPGLGYVVEVSWEPDEAES